jgi:hypothetical protein
LERKYVVPQLDNLALVQRIFVPLISISFFYMQPESWIDLTINDEQLKNKR